MVCSQEAPFQQLVGRDTFAQQEFPLPLLGQIASQDGG
jgi:hypothetical protein